MFLFVLQVFKRTMKLITKRILYSSFIIIFFLSTPIILLYSSGYRWNFAKIKFEKTGSLIIETIPKDTQIYLNNKLVKAKTPAKIHYLLPDEYLVEIKKSGYFPWKNTVRIASNLVTFVKKIYLIKQDLPKLIFKDAIISYKKVPDNNQFIVIAKDALHDQLFFFDADNNEKKSLYTFPNNADPEIFGWSSNNDQLIIQYKTNGKMQHLIFSIKDLSVTDLSKKLQQNFEKIRWDGFLNSQLLGQSQKGLYKIDLKKFSSRLLFSKKIDDFASYDATLFYTTHTPKDVLLVKKEVQNEDRDMKETIKLPGPSPYQIRVESKDMLLAISPSQYYSFLLNSKVFGNKNQNDIEKNIVFEGKIKDIRWSKNKKKFLYFNDFEIFLYDMESKSERLINRFGSRIIDAKFALNENAIVYQLNNSIFITGIVGQNATNVYNLAYNNVSGQYFIGNKIGNTLWFYGSFQNTLGMYRYDLIPDDDLPFFEQVAPPLINY